MLSTKILARKRRRSHYEISQLVRQCRVIDVHESLLREISIVLRRNLGEKVVAQRITSVALRVLHRIYDISKTLRHLLPTAGYETVNEQSSRQRHSSRKKHSGPYRSMEAQNVFYYDMHVSRP